MKNIKNKLLTSIIGIATALTLGYGTANADLFLLKNGSRMYNYSKVDEDSHNVIAKNKKGKKIVIKKSELKDYIFIKEGLNFEKDIDEETANKLEEIKLMEHWGEERLSLPVSDNFIVYDTNFETDHVIYYSQKLRLPKDYFNMPEKGFNTKEEAMKMKKELEAQGYDVFYRVMEASSNSPVISKMLLESKLPRKIETVLHENMHDYLNRSMNKEFFPLDFDEAFACVVGEFGALEYIAEKRGKESEEYKEITTDIRKYNKRVDLIIEYYNKLDSLLKSNMTKEAKLEGKEKLMDELAEKRSELAEEKIEKLNNPGLATYMTYSRYVPLVRKAYEKAGSVKELIKVSKGMADVLKTKPWTGKEDLDKQIISYLENYIRS
ncbi:MAG: aminopeptidase [Nanoarchaeota archaeon]|nr:aminopeptidase [Nanoarchaeota archaeon]